MQILRRLGQKLEAEAWKLEAGAWKLEAAGWRRYHHIGSQIRKIPLD
jgi:hypothetical protein